MSASSAAATCRRSSKSARHSVQQPQLHDMRHHALFHVLRLHVDHQRRNGIGARDVVARARALVGHAAPAQAQALKRETEDLNGETERGRLVRLALLQVALQLLSLDPASNPAALSLSSMSLRTMGSHSASVTWLKLSGSPSEDTIR